jgi:phage terminase large subunit-like protein
MTSASTSRRPRQIGLPKTRDRLARLVAKAEAAGDRDGNARSKALAAALRRLGYKVDEERGLRAVRFIERRCRHTKGRFYGSLFKLTPWQFVIVYSFFGCVDSDGKRLFYRLWFEVGKKNGKTELVAAMLEYCLFGLNEYGAEVYSAAASREQAGMTYKVMRDMTKQDPVLRKRAKWWDSKKTIANTMVGGEYISLSADANYNDGCNPSAVGVDEVHRHKSRDMWDVLRQGQGTREEPIFFGITTAGSGRTGMAWEEHEHADAVIRGIVEDRHLLALVYSVPEEADWTDPKVWKLANPAMGDFLREDDIAEAVVKAQHTPTEEHSVRRLRLNQWVAAETKWLDLNAWDRCGGLVDESKLKGQSFYGGLDISHSQDFTAWCLLFPEDVGGETQYKALWRLWIPEEALVTRGVMKPTLEAWARDRFITIVPGSVVDLRYVEQQIERDCETFNLLEMGYDRFHAHGIISELMEVLGDDKLADVGQTYRFLNAPCKELERLLQQERINHGGNPVLRWMAANAVAEVNQDDLVRPSRKRSADKIDGVVTLLMALNRTLAYEEHDDAFSFYIPDEVSG